MRTPKWSGEPSAGHCRLGTPTCWPTAQPMFCWMLGGWLRADTHWLEGKVPNSGVVAPCVEEACDFCDDGQPAVPHFYYAVHRHLPSELRANPWVANILCLPDEGHEQLQAIAKQAGYLRGLIVQIQRLTHRVSIPIRVVQCESARDVLQADAFDVRPALMRTWAPYLRDATPEFFQPTLRFPEYADAPPKAAAQGG